MNSYNKQALDIIVIRKRVNGKKSANAIDVSTVSAERAATFEDPKTDKERTVSMDYNKYFIEHPECMAGEMRFGFENKDFYRPTSKALYPVKGKNQNEMLAAWMKTFEGMKEDAVSETTPTSSESVYEDLGDDVKEGSLVLDKDDKLCIAQYGKAVPLAVNANKVKGTTKAECFRRYQAIKGALADVLSYQTDNEVVKLTDDLLTVDTDQHGDYVVNKTVVKSYERIEEENGNVTYKFVLNDGLKFNNGEAVTAQDFLAWTMFLSSPAGKEMGVVSAAYDQLPGGVAYRNGETNVLAGLRLFDDKTFSVITLICMRVGRVLFP